MEKRLLEYMCFVLTVIYAKEDRTIVRIGKFSYISINYFLCSQTVLGG